VRSILDGVAAESAKGARTVAAQIFEKLELLERFPRGAPEDPTAPPSRSPARRGIARSPGATRSATHSPSNTKVTARPSRSCWSGTYAAMRSRSRRSTTVSCSSCWRLTTGP